MAQVLTFYRRLRLALCCGAHKIWEKGPVSTVPAEVEERKNLEMNGYGSTVVTETAEPEPMEKRSGSKVPNEVAEP